MIKVYKPEVFDLVPKIDVQIHGIHPQLKHVFRREIRDIPHRVLEEVAQALRELDEDEECPAGSSD